ncbi:MAG: AIR synthase, partial [Maritimibacter sp.]
FLLSVAPEHAGEVCLAFRERGIWADPIGTVTDGTQVGLQQGGETALFWDHAQTPYLSLSRKEQSHA